MRSQDHAIRELQIIAQHLDRATGPQSHQAAGTRMLNEVRPPAVDREVLRRRRKVEGVVGCLDDVARKPQGTTIHRVG